MRLERGAILRTHHQMGLRRMKSSPLHAGVCPKSPHPFPTPSPAEATGSTLPPRQTKLWGKNAILTRGRRLTSAQQGGEKNHPRGVWSIPVPRKGGRWGTTPCPQLTRVPTGKPDGKNNTHKRTTTHQRSARRGENSSKRYVEFSFSLQERSMGDYSPLSALSCPNKRTQQREQWSYASSFWTSCHARKKPYSPIEQATWFSQSTATRHTCPNPNPAAAPEATCSCREKTKSP